MIDLQGQHVVITGASSGIGAAASLLFAQAGAAVMVGYRSGQARAEALLAELCQISGAPHLAFAADLASATAVDALFEEVEAKWGRLDCLVNNAGVWRPNPIDQLDVADLADLLDANVRACFLTVARCVALLRQSPHGNIVNITSTAGQRGEAGYSPYAASKGAMIAATKSWSTELAPEVRVNSVAPGWVETPLNDQPFADGGRESIAAAIPLGRIATAEEIAGPILFLASALASDITGEILNVNGGAVLCG